MTNADYPKEAKQKRMEGVVHFKLQVSALGCPTACEVIQSSGHAILDRATCDLMLRRANFIPKLDANGTPVSAEWTNKFTWAWRP